MPLDNIVVKGAREHNLKNIEVAIPRDKLVFDYGHPYTGPPHRCSINCHLSSKSYGLTAFNLLRGTATIRCDVHFLKV